MNDLPTRTAQFHLPGLFEFYDFYRAFLPLFFERRDYFYDWCEIASIYGAPEGALWGGGRVSEGTVSAREVLALTREFGISARLTFSNSLLTPEHLKDPQCNALARQFAQAPGQKNGAIVHSELLLSFLRENYPALYLVSSTTKVLTAFSDFRAELSREEFSFVVPDFRLNKSFSELASLPQALKDKTEFLANECCRFDCPARKACYEAVSRKNLGISAPEHRCAAPDAQDGYRFSKAMENPGFIGLSDIQEIYLPMGFSQFKIEGRGLGSAVLLEMLLYYLTKPEHHLHVREALYLSSSLDLF